MRKSYVIGILLSCAGLLIVAAGTATHWEHVFAARSSVAAHKTAAAKTTAEPADDRDVKVIRFANNAIETPPFLLPDLQGHVISTAQFPGHVVLLSFWATWCEPCREEIPELKKLQERYKDQLEVIGVSLDDGPAGAVAQFAARAGINYSIIMGSPEITKEYGGVPALPTNFLIDKQGHIVQKHVGLYPLSVYDTEVRALLGMHVDAKIETFKDEGQIFLKNASLATELPGVDLKGLSEAQKRAALKRMNSENCTCGCAMTIAQCRLVDTACPVSKAMAAKIVQEIKSGAPAPAPTRAGTSTGQ